MPSRVFRLRSLVRTEGRDAPGRQGATTTLAAAFTSPGAKRRHVRRLFATIADRYDLVTRLLSYGRDARWKDRVARMVANPVHAGGAELPQQAAPELGVHTDEVLSALGYDRTRIAELRRRGVI